MFSLVPGDSPWDISSSVLRQRPGKTLIKNKKKATTNKQQTLRETKRLLLKRKPKRLKGGDKH